ncbi:hypothetical protein [Novosphingobium sp.]|uniref:hypothetical protein n=1 Tax=Novosphingobium sp. TaxID=1874826 RepID=UPI002B4630A7|nr:hypothetical protein [Novosphingobium sp.]HKR91726.1 hypothetical protein [Novosphingobium sp.]
MILERSFIDAPLSSERSETAPPEWLVMTAPTELPDNGDRRPALGLGIALVFSVLVWGGLAALLSQVI